jgi:hypothetical protein
VAEQERIFDKFSRLEGVNLPKGFGLGLAYCRLAVQAHEGRIWVESEPGVGARFIFTLPVAFEGGFPLEGAPGGESVADESTGAGNESAIAGDESPLENETL